MSGDGKWVFYRDGIEGSSALMQVDSLYELIRPKSNTGVHRYNPASGTAMPGVYSL